MLLLTINTNGVYQYEGIEDSIADELALTLREDAENVKVTIQYLCSVGLAELLDDGLSLPEAVEKVGSESGSAGRVRAHRERKALLGNADVTQCNTECNKNVTLEIEIEKDIEKSRDRERKEKPTRHKYGQYNNVLLSDEEMEKVKAEFPDYQERIERLSEYMASTGKSYKSHLATIRAWARKDGNKPVQQKPKNSFINFRQRDYDAKELERKLLGR